MVCLHSSGSFQSTDLYQLLGVDDEIQQRSSGLFLLKLKECRQISQAAVDDIVSGCSGLFSHTLERLECHVRSTLATVGVDVDSISEELHEVFTNVPDPFRGLETCYKQEKYFTDKLGLIVSVHFCYSH